MEGGEEEEKRELMKGRELKGSPCHHHYGKSMDFCVVCVLVRQSDTRYSPPL